MYMKAESRCLNEDETKKNIQFNRPLLNFSLLTTLVLQEGYYKKSPVLANMFAGNSERLSNPCVQNLAS